MPFLTQVNPHPFEFSRLDSAVSAQLTARGLYQLSVNLLGSKPFISSAVVFALLCAGALGVCFTSLLAYKPLEGRAYVPFQPQTLCGTKRPVSGRWKEPHAPWPGPELGF